MPYMVMEDMYNDPQRLSEELGRMEKDGYLLHAVVPQHQTHDNTGMPQGVQGPLYIFHKPVPPPTTAELLKNYGKD